MLEIELEVNVGIELEIVLGNSAGSKAWNLPLNYACNRIWNQAWDRAFNKHCCWAENGLKCHEINSRIQIGIEHEINLQPFMYTIIIKPTFHVCFCMFLAKSFSITRAIVKGYFANRTTYSGLRVHQMYKV